MLCVAACTHHQTDIQPFQHNTSQQYICPSRNHTPAHHTAIYSSTYTHTHAHSSTRAQPPQRSIIQRKPRCKWQTIRGQVQTSCFITQAIYIVGVIKTWRHCIQDIYWLNNSEVEGKISIGQYELKSGYWYVWR